ncbi:MAG: hypothetical protein M1826_004133 [Phylliscum demangeonii]|nr:MAG: hypothetical protein M1826_004133 [Phylliscum demangeonii]
MPLLLLQLSVALLAICIVLVAGRPLVPAVGRVRTHATIAVRSEPAGFIDLNQEYDALKEWTSYEFGQVNEKSFYEAQHSKEYDKIEGCANQLEQMDDIKQHLTDEEFSIWEVVFRRHCQRMAGHQVASLEDERKLVREKKAALTAKLQQATQREQGTTGSKSASQHSPFSAMRAPRQTWLKFHLAPTMHAVNRMARTVQRPEPAWERTLMTAEHEMVKARIRE